MRNEMDYPEYEGLVQSHGPEVALNVGHTIGRLHVGVMATLQSTANAHGDVSLVVMVNVLRLLSMEGTILDRAIEIMTQNEQAGDHVSAEEFGAALEEAQRQLRAEAAASEAEQAATEAQPEPAPAAE